MIGENNRYNNNISEKKKKLAQKKEKKKRRRLSIREPWKIRLHPGVLFGMPFVIFTGSNFNF